MTSIDSAAGSQWTRRALIGLAAAVPALAVSALAGPIATAEAKRRPTQETVPSLTLATQAQQLTVGPEGGPAVRFNAVLVETDDSPGGTDWFIDEFLVNGVSYVSKLHPPVVNLSDGTWNQRFDVSGLDLNGRVSVQVTYHRGTTQRVTTPVTGVTILPAQALGGGRPPRPGPPRPR